MPLFFLCCSRCSPFRSKGKSKFKSSLSCVSSSGCDGGGGSQGSPPPPENLHYATIRGNSHETGRSGSGRGALHRSSSLHTPHSSPTYVNVNCSSGSGGGGGNKGKPLSLNWNFLIRRVVCECC